MATAQLSYTAVKLATRTTTTTNSKEMDQKSKDSDSKSSDSGSGKDGWVETIRILVNEVNLKIQESIDQRSNAPPVLNLTGTTMIPTPVSQVKKQKKKKKNLRVDSDQFHPYLKGANGDVLKFERKTPKEKSQEQEMKEMKEKYEASSSDEDEQEAGETKSSGSVGVDLVVDPADAALMQYADSLAWELEQVTADPGQAEPQPKYIPGKEPPQNSGMCTPLEGQFTIYSPIDWIALCLFFFFFPSGPHNYTKTVYHTIGSSGRIEIHGSDLYIDHQSTLLHQKQQICDCVAHTTCDDHRCART